MSSHDHTLAQQAQATERVVLESETVFPMDFHTIGECLDQADRYLGATKGMSPVAWDYAGKGIEWMGGYRDFLSHDRHLFPCVGAAAPTAEEVNAVLEKHGHDAPRLDPFEPSDDVFAVAGAFDYLGRYRAPISGSAVQPLMIGDRSVQAGAFTKEEQGISLWQFPLVANPTVAIPLDNGDIALITKDETAYGSPWELYNMGVAMRANFNNGVFETVKETYDGALIPFMNVRGYDPKIADYFKGLGGVTSDKPIRIIEAKQNIDFCLGQEAIQIKVATVMVMALESAGGGDLKLLKLDGPCQVVVLRPGMRLPVFVGRIAPKHFDLPQN